MYVFTLYAGLLLGQEQYLKSLLCGLRLTRRLQEVTAPCQTILWHINPRKTTKRKLLVVAAYLPERHESGINLLIYHSFLKFNCWTQDVSLHHWKVYSQSICAGGFKCWTATGFQTSCESEVILRKHVKLSFQVSSEKLSPFSRFIWSNSVNHSAQWSSTKFSYNKNNTFLNWL